MQTLEKRTLQSVRCQVMRDRIRLLVMLQLQKDHIRIKKECRKICKKIFNNLMSLH